MMRVIDSTERLDRPTVVTVGSFDGVHRGHQALLDAARHLAGERGQALTVVTFNPHPRLVLRPDTTDYVITPTAVKLRYLAGLGVDQVALLAFTPAFARISAGEFLDRELHERLAASAVVVGYNFSFGRGGEGTPETLSAWGRVRGITIKVVGPVADERGAPVSSTAIRQAIRSGALGRAESQLSRPFEIEGVVVPGAGRGRQLGVPTANLEVAAEQVMPPFGVYAGWASLAEGGEYPAATSWGLRPTFGDLAHPLVEAYVIGFSGNLVGKRLRFTFLRYLRGEQRFDSVEDLKAQMAKDIREASRLRPLPESRQT